MLEDVVLLVVGLLAFVLNIYVAIDARATPTEVFQAVGRRRTLWMTLSLFGPFLFHIGVGIGIYYLVRVRPDLRRELAAKGLEHEVSPRAKLVRYVLPALALAVAVVLNANSDA